MDGLMLRIAWTDNDVIGWGVSLAPYLDRWPDTFPSNPDGSGALTASGR
jgi:hypothetical protein